MGTNRDPSDQKSRIPNTYKLCVACKTSISNVEFNRRRNHVSFIVSGQKIASILLVYRSLVWRNKNNSRQMTKFPIIGFFPRHLETGIESELISVPLFRLSQSAFELPWTFAPTDKRRVRKTGHRKNVRYAKIESLWGNVIARNQATRVETSGAIERKNVASIWEWVPKF